MTISPFHGRLAFLGFLAVGGGIALNILYLQDKTVASAAERAKLEKAQGRAAADRSRRLALDPKEGPEVREPKFKAAVAKSPALPVQPPAKQQVTGLPEQPQINRIGRHSPGIRAERPLVEPEPEQTPDVIRLVQQRLLALGYEPGTNDGVTGLVTRGAIIAYEHDNGLPLTGDPSEPLLRHMQGTPGAKEAHLKHARQTRTPHAEQVQRTVQQSLAALGYFTVKVDGRPGEETQRAIREYEMDSGMVPTGRVSAQLLNRLARTSSGTKAGTKPPAR